MPKDSSIKSVLIIGSGPIIIGQACEFDIAAIDKTKDRGRFSTLLKKMGIPYPEFGTVDNASEAIELCRQLGFPLLVCPSYVLGGQKMKIVINEDELETHVINLFKDFPGNKVLLDHFLECAIEASPRASRTVPFIAKAYQQPYVN